MGAEAKHVDRRVGLEGVEDDADGRALAFLGTGRLTLKRPNDIAQSPPILGEGFWFRARVQRAGYRGPPRVDRFAIAGTESRLARLLTPQDREAEFEPRGEGPRSD